MFAEISLVDLNPVLL